MGGTKINVFFFGYNYEFLLHSFIQIQLWKFMKVGSWDYIITEFHSISLIFFLQHFVTRYYFWNIHQEKKFNWIKKILAYEIFICRQWNNLFNSMISFIWMTTVSMKFSDIESIKILFKPTKRVCLVKRLNNTSQNNTMT